MYGHWNTYKHPKQYCKFHTHHSRALWKKNEQQQKIWEQNMMTINMCNQYRYEPSQWCLRKAKKKWEQFLSWIEWYINKRKQELSLENERIRRITKMCSAMNRDNCFISLDCCDWINCCEHRKRKSSFVSSKTTFVLYQAYCCQCIGPTVLIYVALVGSNIIGLHYRNYHLTFHIVHFKCKNEWTIDIVVQIGCCCCLFLTHFFLLPYNAQRRSINFV